MIALVPANGIAQLSAVYDQVELSWHSKALLACLIARLYAAQPTLPLPTLAQVLKLDLNTVTEQMRGLVRASYVKLQTQDDGQHAILNTRHPIFEIRPRTGVLSRLLTSTDKLPSSAVLQQHWRNTFHAQFKRFPERDVKDLVRMRFIIKRQGADAMQAVVDYVNRNRNTPQKCTTLGLFYAYGQSKKV